MRSVHSMRSIRLSRLPLRGGNGQISRRRCYSVKVSGECQNDIKTVSDLKAWSPGAPASDVEVCGWVRSVRKSSAVRFIDITDGSSMRPVQVVVDKTLAAEYVNSDIVIQGCLLMEI